MKTVLVTGASSGIGEAYVYDYAKRGYNIILVARSYEKMKEIAERVQQKYHVSTEIIALDLSKSNSAEELYSIIQSKRLFVDVLINNAGFATKGKFTQSKIAEQAAEIKLNVLTLTKLTYFILQDMLQRDTGQIINIASAAAFTPLPYGAVYSATKSFVLSLTESLSFEYRKTNIQFLAICPSSTRTNFFTNFNATDFKMRTAEDVARSTQIGIKKKQTIKTDGVIAWWQSKMNHFLTRKMVLAIVGRVGEKTWN